MLPHDFRLLTLGRFTLQGGEGEPAAEALRKQRRKLAVLAVLALEREPIPRDLLLDMFWGEQEESRARHSLSEALSHLRRVLGPHSITARGTEVELSAAVPLSVDARELAEAAAEECWSDAVRLYGGAFLDSVHPGDSTRLETWIDQHRREFERIFLRSCEGEFGRLGMTGRWEEAAVLARRWADADPLSEAAALALLGALEAPGTEEADARALQAYEALRKRLERKFGCAPAKRVQLRAEVLAERLSEARARSTEGVTGNAPAVAVPSGAPSVTSPDTPGLPDTPVDVAARARWPRHGALWLAAGALVATIVVALGLMARGSRSPSAPAAGSRVAVLPFSVRGSADYGYLREGVVDLLSADLDGAGPFRTVDPQAVLIAAREAAGRPRDGPEVAQRLGADLFVRGEVVVAGGGLRISASLFEPSGGGKRVAEATVDGSPDDLIGLVDRLTVQLLAGSGSPVPALGRLAALTTTSLPALKAYLEGESDFRQGLYASAFEAFHRAAELDSTFALAHYRVAQASNWAVPPGWAWDSILVRSRRAHALADRLPPRARLLVDAYAAWVSGAYDDAERRYRAVVRTYPDDVEAWYGLAEVLFHSNPMRGRSCVEAEEAFERVLALEPDNVATLSHLLRLALRQGHSGWADSLVTRLDSLEALPRAAEFHALRAFAQGTESDRAGALAEIRASGDDELVRVTAHRVAIFAGNLDGSSRLLLLLLDDGLAPDVRAHAHVWLAQLEVAHGRWRAADSALDAAAALDPDVATEARALLAALPFGPDGAVGGRAAEAALQSSDGVTTTRPRYPWLAVYDGLHGILREYLLGLLALRRGDAVATRQRAAALDAQGQGQGGEARELARGLAESLRGHMAAGGGDATEALARFDAARLQVSEGLLESQIGSQAFERWARAELLFRTGRLSEALPWYATLAETSIDGLIYLAPAESRQAEISERLGDPAGAIAHYRRFLELWREADPELAPWVAHAQSRLQALEQGGNR